MQFVVLVMVTLATLGCSSSNHTVAARDMLAAVPADPHMTVIWEGQVVVPTMSLGQAVGELHFPFAHQDINDKNFFPTSPTDFGTKHLVLVAFDQTLGTSDAVAALAANGLRPATVRGLVAFAGQPWRQYYPHRILALGSPWRLEHDVQVGGAEIYFPYLGEYAAKPMVDLYWFGYGWDTTWYFLAERV